MDGKGGKSKPFSTTDLKKAFSKDAFCILITVSDRGIFLINIMATHKLSTGKIVNVSDIDYVITEKSNGYCAIVYKQKNPNGGHLLDECDFADCFFLADNYDIRLESR